MRLKQTWWRTVGHLTLAWCAVRWPMERRWKAFKEACRALYRRFRPLKPQQIQFPIFEVAANPTIKLSDIKARRFSIIDRGETIRVFECARCGWEDLSGELCLLERGLGRCPVCLSTKVKCILDERVVDGDIILYKESPDRVQ